ncbi:MAG: c-type cytochrome [Bacteroidota bacterium]
MKKILLLSAIVAFMYACSSNTEKKEPTESGPSANDLMKDDTVHYAPDAKGIGKFTHVDINPALNAKMAGDGNGIYDLKCSACHKLTKERLVGPGWEGVTARRKPEWIMNFATNTDEMIDKDAQAQAMLELCMVRMPNQSLSDDDARAVYEFMRKNDGVK